MHEGLYQKHQIWCQIQMLNMIILLQTSKVKCENAKCPTITQGVMPEVATYQYNTETGMLGYTCIVCGFYWKNLAAPMHVTESQIQAKNWNLLDRSWKKI